MISCTTNTDVSLPSNCTSAITESGPGAAYSLSQSSCSSESSPIPIIDCMYCNRSNAAVSCAECKVNFKSIFIPFNLTFSQYQVEAFCPQCFALVHRLGTLQSHAAIPLPFSPLSSAHNLNWRTNSACAGELAHVLANSSTIDRPQSYQSKEQNELAEVCWVQFQPRGSPRARMRTAEWMQSITQLLAAKQ